MKPISDVWRRIVVLGVDHLNISVQHSRVGLPWRSGLSSLGGHGTAELCKDILVVFGVCARLFRDGVRGSTSHTCGLWGRGPPDGGRCRLGQVIQANSEAEVPKL